MVEIQYRCIEGSAEGPHLLITGGVHGDEFDPMVAIRRLSREFRANEQLIRGRLTLVPIVNEPAFLRGARCGDDDLDLARTCPGRLDGSPTEQIAARLSEMIRDADYYIDLHTGGSTMSVFPLAGYCMHPDSRILQQQREMATAFNLPLVWGTSPEHEGRSLSVARDAGVPAIYTEYLGSGLCHPDGVQDYVDGCLNVLGWLKLIDRAAPQSRVQHVVEDERPQSGHMQVCNPSPKTGLFEPRVRLGDRVEEGQCLGVVWDYFGDDPREVTATRAGLVIVLRTFTRVREGESLGVVG